MMKMIKRIFLIWMVFAILPMLTISVAVAQDEEPAQNNPVALFLAGLTDVTYEDIIGYQQEGFGLGQIGRALQFAEATDQEWIDVMTQAQAMGWGQLYREAGLHPGGQGLGSLIGKGRPDWAGGPPDHAGPPPHAGPKEDTENPENEAGPPDHAGPKENNGNGNGPPDHAGPKENNGNGNGPPDHAGPKENNGNGNGPPDHAGPKENNGNGPPDHAGPKNGGDDAD
jgi:hypothetical protein